MQYHLFVRVLLCSFASITCSLVQTQSPSAPRNLRSSLSLIEDPRPGFEGHVVIILEWDRPDEGIEELTGYNLTVQGIGACGNPGVTHRLIEKNATRHELMALSPGELPQFGPSLRTPCQSLLTTLTSLPDSGGNSILWVAPLEDVPVTSPAQPDVNITCGRTLNESTGLITAHLEWNNKYNPLIQEAISIYTFTYILIPDGLQGSVSISDPSIPSQDMTKTLQSRPEYLCPNGTGQLNLMFTITNDTVSGKITVRDYCPHANTSEPPQPSYLLSLSARRNESHLWWRPIPSPMDCAISASPGRPGVVPVETIKILDEPPLSVQEVEGAQRYIVTLGLSWDPPLTPFGAVDQYEVYVGDRSQEEQTVVNPFTQLVAGQTFTIINGSVPIAEREIYLFIQIRYSNGFLFSKWSEPLTFRFRDRLDTQDEKSTSTSLSVPVIVTVVIAAVLLLLLL